MISGTVTESIPYISKPHTVTHTVAQGVTEGTDVPRTPFVVELSSRSASFPFVDCEDNIPASITPILGVVIVDAGRSFLSDGCSLVANVVNGTSISPSPLPPTHFHLRAA